MAILVKEHDEAEEEPTILPQFLVIAVLESWLLGEEKSTDLFPFLENFDFLELMGIFELNREYFKNEKHCTIKDIQDLSFRIIKRLKNCKLKVNKKRVSKTRKKK